MSTILLADDSPHALRMGERILKEEGYQVVSVADGETAASCIAEVDPDLLIADAFLAGRSGFELCRYSKTHHPHTRVILTAGLLEKLDEDAARQAGCDAILRKPFEASAAMPSIRPLVQEAQLARGLFAEALAGVAAQPVSDAPAPSARPQPPDPKRVEAAIALALEAALPALVREITEKVLIALGH